MINFPLYVMRGYEEKFEEDGFTILQTHRSRYVLDYAIPDQQFSYSTRRVMLLGEKLPYMLYPLKFRVTTLSQVIANRNKSFIDATGKIVIWEPKRFHHVRCSKILHREMTKSGSMLYRAAGISENLISIATSMSYVRTIQYQGTTVIYDFVDERTPTIRRKI